MTPSQECLAASHRRPGDDRAVFCLEAGGPCEGWASEDLRLLSAAELSPAAAGRLIEATAAALDAAKDDVRAARLARDDALRAGARAGLTGYAMARPAGVSQQVVRRILAADPS